LSIAAGGSTLLENVVTETVDVTIPQNIDWHAREFVVNFSGAGIQTQRAVTITQAANGIEINGLIWASFNVDDAGTFTKNPGEYGKYYQFNSLEPGWTGGRSYIYADWAASNDPCPDGWRLPTRDEYTSFRNYIESNPDYSRWELASARSWGSVGLWVGADALSASSENTGNCIFLPAAGRLRYDNGILDLEGIRGYYWSKSTVTGEPVNPQEGHNFNFIQGAIMTETGNKARGCTIRPVRNVE
jgi:uncharacterized protein (TIGR02145 family)